MQKSIELANNLLSILKNENFYDAVDGLNIALILLSGTVNSSRTKYDEIPQFHEVMFFKRSMICFAC